MMHHLDSIVSSRNLRLSPGVLRSESAEGGEAGSGRIHITRPRLPATRVRRSSNGDLGDILITILGSKL